MTLQNGAVAGLGERFRVDDEPTLKALSTHFSSEDTAAQLTSPSDGEVQVRQRASISTYHTAFTRIMRSPSIRSVGTLTSYISAVSRLSQLLDSRPRVESTAPTRFESLLQDRGLIPRKDQEINWSGRGQHVEYDMTDELPLISLTVLGHTPTAQVDKVLCRRIHLARKVVTCRRKLTIEQAIKEVDYLERLRHPHIVQLVGTYCQGRKFAILLYPAADCNLETYMEEKCSAQLSMEYLWHLKRLWWFLSCLAHALRYVHQQGIKHMDIKPKNIFVKLSASRVYLGDFGISREIVDGENSQTDGPTARSPIYAAPEVFGSKSRGRAADVFSLGCVFAEMLTVLVGESLDEFAKHRARNNRDGDYSFHRDENMPNVQRWLQRVVMNRDQETCLDDPRIVAGVNIPVREFLVAVVMAGVMMSPHVDLRPKADRVVERLESNPCCEGEREGYELGN